MEELKTLLRAVSDQMAFVEGTSFVMEHHGKVNEMVAYLKSNPDATYQDVMRKMHALTD